MSMLGRENQNHKLNYRFNTSYNKTVVKDFTFVPAFIPSTTNYLAKSNETLTQEYRTYNDFLVENLLTYDASLGRNNINIVVGQVFFNSAPPPDIYTLSLHDALPI